MSLIVDVTWYGFAIKGQFLYNQMVRLICAYILRKAGEVLNVNISINPLKWSNLIKNKW